MSISWDLWVYCDLHDGMFEALHNFDTGGMELSRYNLVTLRKLVTPDEKALNGHGKQVLARARQIVAGTFVKEAREKPAVPSADAAKCIRRDTPFKKMKSKQVKCLYDLWAKPGQGWKCTISAYGYDEVNELIGWGLILGESKLGSPLEVNGEGVELLVKFCGVVIDITTETQREEEKEIVEVSDGVVND